MNEIFGTVLVFIGIFLFIFGEFEKGNGGWVWHVFALAVFASVAFSIGRTTVSGHSRYSDIGTIESGVKYSTYKVSIPDPVYKYYVFVKEGEDVPVFYQFSNKVEIPEGDFTNGTSDVNYVKKN
jgi:hypothetical protein